ncbi:hypothetical protein K474DRAFT_1745914 [Panus rudis PR-1116 ss-1]|nr:hypothetical protein K474DRAFT_1745914 [Panus rudis PR-1116 ss-1]
MSSQTVQVKKLGEREREGEEYKRACQPERSHWEDSECKKDDFRELMVTLRGCRGRQLLQSCWTALPKVRINDLSERWNQVGGLAHLQNPNVQHCQWYSSWKTLLELSPRSQYSYSTPESVMVSGSVAFTSFPDVGPVVLHQFHTERMLLVQLQASNSPGYIHLLPGGYYECGTSFGPKIQFQRSNGNAHSMSFRFVFMRFGSTDDYIEEVNSVKSERRRFLNTALSNRMPASRQPKNDNVIEAQGDTDLEVKGGIEVGSGIEDENVIEDNIAGFRSQNRDIFLAKSDSGGPNLQDEGKLEDKDKSRMVEEVYRINNNNPATSQYSGLPAGTLQHNFCEESKVQVRVSVIVPLDGHTKIEPIQLKAKDSEDVTITGPHDPSDLGHSDHSTPTVRALAVAGTENATGTYLEQHDDGEVGWRRVYFRLGCQQTITQGGGEQASG